MKRDNLLFILILSILLYGFFLNTSFSEGAGNGCMQSQVQNPSAMQENICFDSKISTTVTKQYFGIIRLPVYKAGYNIEIVHFAFAAYILLLSSITLKKYAPAHN